jgi:hypothetical protein
MADNKLTEAIGSEIAGSLVALPLFQLLVQKGLISADEAEGIIGRASSSLRNIVSAEGRAAVEILNALQKRLRS